jgi:hypothetical protein
LIESSEGGVEELEMSMSYQFSGHASASRRPVSTINELNALSLADWRAEIS